MDDDLTAFDEAVAAYRRVREERDKAREMHAGLLEEVVEREQRIKALEQERDHWKANHDNQVRLKQELLDRPDLGDRARSIQRLRGVIDAVEWFAKCLGENAQERLSAYQYGAWTHVQEALEALESGGPLPSYPHIRMLGSTCSCAGHEDVPAVGEAQAGEEDDPRWYPYCEECCEVMASAGGTPVRRWDRSVVKLMVWESDAELEVEIERGHG